MWTYEGVEFTSEMIGDSYGFVYEIEEVSTGKRYIGKKFFWKKKILPITKTRKRRKHTLVESDWQTYYGSHTKIKQLLSEGKQEYFSREILEFAFNKKHLTYLETKYQFSNNVLENTEYINDNILGKFFRKDLVNPNI